MKTAKGDVFEMPKDQKDAVCITTNGMIRKDGRAVMGKGIALEADKRFDLAPLLATYLHRYGNKVFNMGVRVDSKTHREMCVITFPTKNHWKDPSDLSLIKKSAEELAGLADKLSLRTVYLPKPGCGCGGLNWKDVREILEPILDDRFVIVEL